MFTEGAGLSRELERSRGVTTGIRNACGPLIPVLVYGGTVSRSAQTRVPQVRISISTNSRPKTRPWCAVSESPAERLRRTLDRLSAQLPERELARSVPVGSDEELIEFVGDRSQPSEARRSALGVIVSRLRTERRLTEILLAVLDDPDESLVCEAIRSSPPFDGRIRVRLHAMLDDPRPAVWSEVASVLARRMDPAVAPRLLAWFRGDDAARWRAAVAGLACVLTPESSMTLFQQDCARADRSDDDRLALEAALEEARRRAEGRRKVFGGDDDE
jgi:hypothetical protein